jgi:perosamine synthetase
MRIPLFRTRLAPEAFEAAAQVLDSGWLGHGENVVRFEEAFASYLGVEHCVAVSSGTAALHLALRILDLPEGAEVVTTPMTWVSSHLAILYERCRPVMADIQPLTGNVDPAEIERRISPRTGAIMIVHYCGYPCDLDEVYEVARLHDLPVIEDCSHAAGATYRERRIGSAATLQCFSFGPIKNLTTIQGGAVTSADGRHFGRLRSLRSLGFETTVHERLGSRGTTYRSGYRLAEPGFRYELSDLHAAIGLAQLPHLDAENAVRAERAGSYAERLRGVAGLELLQYAGDRRSSYHMYPVLVEERDRLAEKLRGEEIDVGVHYPPNPLIQDSPPPRMERFSARTLTLPLHPSLTEDEAESVAATIAAGW